MPVPKENIELWRVDLDHWDEVGLDPTSVTEGDRDAAERLRDKVVARRLLARRSAVRSLLASTLGTETSELAIGRTCPVCGGSDHGRPFVVGAPVEFSVSASGRMAVLAISERPVGVDIERVLDDITPLAAALSGPEQAALSELHADQQGIGFLRLWTAKEAVLKAGNRSLADDPAGAEVSGLLTADRGVALDRGRSWTVRLLTVGAPPRGQAIVAVADASGVDLVRRSVGGPPAPAVA